MGRPRVPRYLRTSAILRLRGRSRACTRGGWLVERLRFLVAVFCELASARFSSEADFCGRAVFMAVQNEGPSSLKALPKEVVGIHVLLTRPLCGGGIPRRLLRRVWLAKPTSAPLRC